VAGDATNTGEDRMTIPRLHIAAAGMAVLCLLAACAPYRTHITRTEGLEFPALYRFRINYDIHDPDGQSITVEIMNDDLERWLLFVEMCDRARVAMEERGYKWVYDPNERVDFIVDVAFSAFYTEKLEYDRLINQPPATLLVGSKDGDTYTHVVVLTALARNPNLAADDYVVLWEGRGTSSDENDTPRVAGFPIMVELLKEFPHAQRPRRRR
jgi:hypothetical protein